ncbi:MAG: shikimate dehydrogenase [Pyrinomonadaceae bacterium]
MKTNQQRICVPICEPTIDALERAGLVAAELGDLIEVRLDCLGSSESAEYFSNLSPVLKKIRKPVIVTLRPAEQGGKRQLDAKSRLLFWLFNRPVADYFDIEFDVATAPSLLECGEDLDWTRVICSYHNFVRIPDNIVEIYERMLKGPARILKFAVQANDVTDCIPMFQLLGRARKDGIEMIAIAMGSAGVVTRILGPARGAFLTYGALEVENGTAPGQITARELLDVYRVQNINEETEIFGVIGEPVSHSLSPYMHNAAFAALGINAVYVPLQVHLLEPFIRRMLIPDTKEIDWNIRGLSITAPHKVPVMDHLGWTSPAAKQIGAANTIRITGNLVEGHNTDGDGFLKPLMARVGQLRDARCAVIGTGGAANAVVWALTGEAASVTVFARNVRKAQALAERFGTRWQSLEAAVYGSFEVVINATPLGTAGELESETPATADQLRGARLAYDLVYNPKETKFMQLARDAKCDTLGGLGMLVAQAAEQFQLWTGISPPVDVMLEAAERALKSEHERTL